MRTGPLTKAIAGIAFVVIATACGGSNAPVQTAQAADSDQAAPPPQPASSSSTAVPSPAVDPGPTAATGVASGSQSASQTDSTSTPTEQSGQLRQPEATEQADQSGDSAPFALYEPEFPFEPIAVAGSIEEVDFLNGFSHPTGWGPPVVVTDGEATAGKPGDGDYSYFVIDEVVIGDLDGDGSSEAAVSSLLNTGGSGFFSSVDVYRIEAGVLHHMGSAAGGDRAHGGVFDIDIVNGLLTVQQFGTMSGACCPESLIRSDYVLGDRRPLLAQQFEPIAWLDVSGTDVFPRLRFLSGTRSAAVTYGDGPFAGFTFDARAGQTLELQWLSRDKDGTERVFDGRTGVEVAPLAAEDRRFLLPSTSTYRVEFNRGPIAARFRHTVFAIIHDSVPFELPTWSPRVEEVIHSIDPPVRTVISRPVFETLPGGSDVALVNDLVAGFVDDELADWLAYAATDIHPEPHGPSEYELVFDLTLVGPDLVSIHFSNYEYLCCRPYPNIRQRSIVIELATGRLLEAGDIIDENRLDEVQRIWVAALDRETEEGTFGQFYEPGRTYFSSLTLSPAGVVFGTDRGTFGGAAQGPTTQLVTWSELGDLVDPSVAERSRRAMLPEPWLGGVPT